MKEHQSRDSSERRWAGMRQSLTICLCLLLLAQVQAPLGMSQEPASPQPSTSQTATPAVSPGSAETQKSAGEDLLPSAPAPQISMLVQQSQPAQQSQPSQQPVPQQPVGTAAAPYEKPTGVPGSRPAGAAIAPAKQRRVRAIVIRVGLILAGAGAVGAVVGLSKASHSQP